MSAALRTLRGGGRLLDGLEQAEPVVGGGGVEDVAGAVDDRRDADVGERGADHLGVLVAGDEHGEVAGPDRPAVARCRRRSRSTMVARELSVELEHDVGGQVARDERPGPVHLEVAAVRGEDGVGGVAPDVADPHRRGASPADEAALLGGARPAPVTR